MADRFADVEAVADAVLFEGYLLYPYRASAAKNQVRWQWGVLVPAGWGEDSGETPANRTECVVELRGDLHVRVRFLHLERRTVLDAAGTPVASLLAGDVRHVPFEEGLPRHVDATLTRAQLLAGATVPITEPGGETVEEVEGGRVVRTREPLTAEVTLTATEPPGPYDVLMLRVGVRNVARADPSVPRDEALRTSLIGTHLLLAADPGSFVSPTDPPEWASRLVARCRSEHAWPVLAGPQERSDLLLSAPIIVGDHAQIAPESPLDLFDGTENDEILTLRTMTLTDEEKAEARATDPRAASIIDAIDALPPELLDRLHGAIRSLRPAGSPDSVVATPRLAERDASRGPGPRESGDPDQRVGSSGPASRPFRTRESADPGTRVGDVPTAPSPVGRDVRVDDIPTFHTPMGGDAPDAVPPASTPWWDPGADASVNPETDSVLVGAVPVAKGSSVVLRPGRCADAQDAFLAGMRATVQAVVHDVDGRVHVAVSVDGDPAAELQVAHGRFRYFRPDELEAVP